MNDIENRLRKLKPKVSRDIRSDILAEIPSIVVPPKKRSSSTHYLLACSCSFLLGLLVMYGVMRPADSAGQKQEASPQGNENRPSPFTNDSYAVKPTPKREDRPVKSGNEYSYYNLLRKYQQ